MFLDDPTRERDRTLEFAGQIILRQRADQGGQANGISVQRGFRHRQRVVTMALREMQVRSEHECVGIVPLERQRATHVTLTRECVPVVPERDVAQ